MDKPKLHAALAVILRELEIPFDVKTMEGRLCMQKAIYLAQRAGPDLGYRFNWYLRGPYSPALAEAYFEAYPNRASFQQYSAGEKIKKSLRSLRKLFEAKPESASKPQWLEALASLHYLQYVQKWDTQELEEVFRLQKPNLATLYKAAKERLDEYGPKPVQQT